MKQCYPKVPLFLAFFSLILYLPLPALAQCLCSNGEAPQTVVHNRALTTSMEETIFDFPQFDPSIGVLICANVNAAITSNVRIRMENDEIYPASYRISYKRTSTISGPGLSPTLVHSFSKNYGPYDLAATDEVYFSGPDYIITPRDTILKNKILTRTISDDVTPFLGSGNVAYQYSLHGNSVISGGGNYLGGPLTSDHINFTLTYSYCQAEVLAATIRDFNVQNNHNKSAMIEWSTVNEENGNIYEIEIRKNNGAFKSIASIPASIAAGGTAAEYQYQYQFDPADAGQLYFRIRQINSQGKIEYSPVRTLRHSVDEGFRVYPNPASTRFSMQFGEILNGNYSVRITNQAGMLIMIRQVRVSGNNKIDIDFPVPPVAGMYYIRAVETSGGKTFSGKILFR